MRTLPASACRVVFLAIGVVLFAAPGYSQSQGIVTADRSVIWRADSSVVITVVDTGVVLELTGRSGRWYEVIVPPNLGGREERGRISITQLRLLGDSAEPAERGGAPPTETGSTTVSPSRPGSPQGRAVGVRGFAHAGLMRFAARQTFAAMTGDSFGPSFGGGAQVRFSSGLYLQGSIERFRKTGERVFVFNGTTFPLGVPDTITLESVVAALGYRPRTLSSIQPYLGAGLGAYRLREVSPFDTEDEQVNERHLGYHVQGGVEFFARGWLTPALEARFTAVPDALRGTGVAAEFDESDLGGWQIYAKILIGR